MICCHWSIAEYHCECYGLWPCYNGLSPEEKIRPDDASPRVIMLSSRLCSTCMKNIGKMEHGRLGKGLIIMKALVWFWKINTVGRVVWCNNGYFAEESYMDRTDKLGPEYIVLLTSNFVKEGYFPREQIVFPISILIISLQHFTVHCLFKTKLPNCLPSLYATGKRQYEKLGNEEPMPLRQPILENCQNEAELYSRRSSDANLFHSAHQSTYHQQKNLMRIENVWLRTPWTGHRRCPSFIKLLPFSSNLPLTCLLAVLLLTSMFPYSMSSSSHINYNRTSVAKHSDTHEHHPPVFCDNYDLRSLLSSDKNLGCTTTACVYRHDGEAKAQYEQFAQVMQKYATSINYSSQWSMGSCKVAYKDWICSQHHRVFKDDVPDRARVILEPCPLICKTVESSCPFFRVYNGTKLYGGQPTFLCGAKQKKSGSGLSNECYFITPPAKPKSECRSDAVFGFTGNASNDNKTDAMCEPELHLPHRTIAVKNLTAASSGSCSPNWPLHYLLCDVRLFLYFIVMKIHDLIKNA